MSAPRHLWSENWQEQSAAAAEELARRRAQAQTTEFAEPGAPAATRRRSRRAPAALRRLRVSRRRLRAALLVALVTALAAGAAYTAASLLSGAGTTSSTLASDTQPWLGVKLASSVIGNSGLTVGGFPGGFAVATGALVTEVIPGSPAAAAGLAPGDVLTSVNDRPVASPADVQAALAGLRAGDPVSLQYQQGALTYTTQATLATRPAGSP